MTLFIPAETKQQFNQIAKLADVIWREHYTPIIGIDQVEYMIKKFQSTETMYTQYINGYQYFMIFYDNQLVGYLSIQKQKKKLFISKIYISKEMRGKKIGKETLLFIQKKAKDMTCNTLELGVNKNNMNAIAAYEAFGFKNKGSMVTDIGSGYIMDDYKMVKSLMDQSSNKSL